MEKKNTFQDINESSKNNTPPQKKFNRMKSSSFFGPSNQKKSSGFFGSSNSSSITDRPAGESLGEFYEIRKKIIFKHINIKNNEKEFAKFIFESQDHTNNVIKPEGIFLSANNVYDWTVTLKENVANYCLVIKSYLDAKKDITAHHLFLLLDIQNRKKFEKIFKEISKNFRNMSNSNRIGKYYPSIIKMFLQMLAVIIKYSFKFNKQQLENYYSKKYLMTLDIVKNTVINRFIVFNAGVENDFKNLARFFFFDCAFKIAIYSFYRYHSFNYIIDILNSVLDIYKDVDDSFMINSEHILLLKINYNLGLFLYMMGKGQEALYKFSQALSFLKHIYHFPYITIKEIPKDKISNNTINSNIKSIQDKSTISTINIDESVEKIMKNQSFKKRSASTNVDLVTKNKTKEVDFGFKEKFFSVIHFGKNKIYFFENEKKVENYIGEQIFIEIELMIAEIELDRKNYEKAFLHVNEILNLFNMPINSIKNRYAYTRTFSELDRGSFTHKKGNKYIKRNVDISDINRRRLCFILSQIELELGINQKKNMYFYNSMKSLEEIQDISSYDSASSNSNKQFHVVEFDKEGKIKQATENFFLFICSLSLYQLKILNEFQPEQSQKRDELPIIFPNQFKDCLTFKQRLALNHLDTMSLSRCVILLDSTKEISPFNLNYFLLNKKKPRKQNLATISSELTQPGYKETFLKKLENQNKKKENSISNSTNISMNFNNEKKRYGLNYDNNLNSDKNNLKKKLFIQGKFQKFLEEDENFNNKIEEIMIKEDNKIQINRIKIYKVMNELNPEEKELLMQDKSYVNNFVKNIKKKLKRNRSTYK